MFCQWLDRWFSSCNFHLLDDIGCKNPSINHNKGPMGLALVLGWLVQYQGIHCIGRRLSHNLTAIDRFGLHECRVLSNLRICITDIHWQLHCNFALSQFWQIHGLPNYHPKSSWSTNSPCPPHAHSPPPEQHGLVWHYCKRYGCINWYMTHSVHGF